jgi:hypothetical protein
MKRMIVLLLVAGLLLTACAQIPMESVELSATIGRDLATMHDAHRALAGLLFARMRQDINRYVDEVYAPFQIKNAIDRQSELAESSDPAERSISLILAIDAAFEADAPPELRKKVSEGMEAMVDSIRKDVEEKRKELLDPLDAQESEAVGKIDAAYQQVLYANSIVTGHLSSAVKVHKTQTELLHMVGIERELSKEVSDNLARVSGKISNLVDAAEEADANLEMIEEGVRKLKEAVEELGMNPEEDR